jgi:hypothetical protein|tara:strand:- start:445 stop:900 length:456 start_codon:yes stop_codon:yes gene_type:complete
VEEEVGTRDWVFTINNPNPKQLDSLHSYNDVGYMVYQLELSNTGTEHIQGYVEFKEELTWPQVKNIFGETTFFKRRMARRKNAREYCMKDKSRIRGPWEIGNWEEVRENDTSDNQCEYILQGKKKKYRNRRCKNLVRNGKYCGVHKEIMKP